MNKRKKKVTYVVEASDLKVRFVELKKSIEAINNPAEFISTSLHEYLVKKHIYKKTIRALKNQNGDLFFKNDKLNNYAKFSRWTEDVNEEAFTEYNHRLRDYYLDLPEKIQQLKQLKHELKALIKAADNRAPHFFKTGNLKESIEEVIDLKAVNDLLAFAEEARDNLVANKELFISSQDNYYSI